MLSTIFSMLFFGLVLEVALAMAVAVKSASS
jgi:hypothetical protein